MLNSLTSNKNKVPQQSQQWMTLRVQMLCRVSLCSLGDENSEDDSNSAITSIFFCKLRDPSLDPFQRKWA